jgi:hypothetical protein
MALLILSGYLISVLLVLWESVLKLFIFNRVSSRGLLVVTPCSVVVGCQRILCLTKYHAMKTLRSGGIAPRIFNLVTRWRCGQLHPPAALSPMIEPPEILDRSLCTPEPVWTRWRRGKKSLPCPYRESNPGRPACSLVTISCKVVNFPVVS